MIGLVLVFFLLSKEDFRRNGADVEGVLSLDDLMPWPACPNLPPPPGLQYGKI